MALVPLILQLLNVMVSAAVVGFAAYQASGSVEGALVAGVGSAINHLRENPVSQTLGSKALPTIFLCTFLITGNALAASTLEWDRNEETDMDHYNVYSCATKGCVVDKVTATKSANIPQVAVGLLPSFPLPANTEGSSAVSATDSSGNESGLSVSLPFDQKSPGVPTNPHLK